MATMKTLLLFCSVITLAFLYGVQGQRCPVGTELSDCSSCWSSCQKPGTVCDYMCRPGCVCKEKEYVIGPDYKCIPKEECPKA